MEYSPKFKKHEWHKYIPDYDKDKFGIIKEICPLCYGTKYYMGTYQHTCCKICSDGYVYRIFKKRKSKIKKEKSFIDITLKYKYQLGVDCDHIIEILLGKINEK